jgi:hypothetical protein
VKSLVRLEIFPSLHTARNFMGTANPMGGRANRFTHMGGGLADDSILGI